MKTIKSFLPLLLIFLASLPIKFAAAQNMPFDIDIVPVLERNLDYLLPPVGTLSSVAAYNMPMLEWLHWPATRLIGNAWWAIFLSLSLFNLLGTIAVFKLSEGFFGRGAAYATAAFFTFSEVGVSSTYTAWAQLLLPSYFALCLWCLWHWHIKTNGLYLALAGMVATAAFMTHFSAILLYPAMLVFAVIHRSRWQWRWLFLGGLACLVMLLPYLLFEVERGFVDLEAFLKQETLVPPEIMALYRPYAPENQGSIPSSNPQAQAETQSEESPRQSSSRLERAIAYAVSLPQQLFRAVQAAFPLTSRGLGDFGLLAQMIFALPMLFFWLGLPLALWRRDAGARHYGRIGMFLGVILLCMVLTRNLDDLTYFMGFISLQTVMAGYAISVFLGHQELNPGISGAIYCAPTDDNRLEQSRSDFGATGTSSMDAVATDKRHSVEKQDRIPKKYRAWLLAGLVLLFCLAQVAERTGRLLQFDNETFSAYNVSIYPNISAAVDAIAADWQGGDSLIVSYDILPEMPNLWWTPAWNHVDPSYRMGMNFDFLLRYHHGLHNANQDAIGTVENADYIVIYSPAAERYNLEAYEIWRFGAIWLLKPLVVERD